jgi:hypothetical protein
MDYSWLREQVQCTRDRIRHSTLGRSLIWRKQGRKDYVIRSVAGTHPRAWSSFLPDDGMYARSPRSCFVQCWAICGGLHDSRILTNESRRVTRSLTPLAQGPRPMTVALRRMREDPTLLALVFSGCLYLPSELLQIISLFKFAYRFLDQCHCLRYLSGVAAMYRGVFNAL